MGERHSEWERARVLQSRESGTLKVVDGQIDPGKGARIPMAKSFPMSVGEAPDRGLARSVGQASARLMYSIA